MIMAQHPRTAPARLPVGAKQDLRIQLEMASRVRRHIGCGQDRLDMVVPSHQQPAYLHRSASGFGHDLFQQRP